MTSHSTILRFAKVLLPKGMESFEAEGLFYMVLGTISGSEEGNGWDRGVEWLANVYAHYIAELHGHLLNRSVDRPIPYLLFKC